MNTQGLERQISGAQKDLEALRVDEAELARLHTEKTAEFERLRSSKSRDFSGLAALEGQRAALQTMLEEQHGEIRQVQARISDLEAQHGREARLEAIEQAAEQIGLKRAEIHAGLLALVDTVTAEMTRLIGLRGEWKQLRMGFIEHAVALGVPIQNGGFSQEKRGETQDFLQLLEARGVDVEALQFNLFGEEWAQQTRVDREEKLPTNQGEVSHYASFEERLRTMVGTLYGQSVHAWLTANTPTAKAARGEA